MGLSRDTSAALATIHEWINSFVPINRLPTDVFSLIPTHLSSQKDRFRSTFVSRHWRRTFLQYAALWSRLDLSKGEIYVETLLERAKGSPLNVLASSLDPIGAMILLPPYTKQIADIEFTNSGWAVIRRFSEITSGPLPLLRTLNINVIWGIDPNSPDMVTSPSHPLFSGAVGLKELRLHAELQPFLRNFIFPNLTSFELSVTSVEQFYGSQLLDFLETSPMLQVVDVRIITTLSLEGVPRERVVVLHHVESLCLTARDGNHSYKLASHMLCPSIKNTSLMHMDWGRRAAAPPLETFPVPDLLNAIIRQYTRSPIEEITLETKIEAEFYDFVTRSVTFRSADATVVRLCFDVSEYDDPPFTRTVFPKACRAIRDLPLLANIKHLHVRGLFDIEEELMTQIAHEFGGLLKSLGSLEELTISNCDMRPYFSYYPEIVGYPPIRALTLSDPWNTLKEDAAGGLVGLAKAQHELGVPFERVTIRSYLPLAVVGERLKPWVGVVDCSLYDTS